MIDKGGKDVSLEGVDLVLNFFEFVEIYSVEILGVFGLN